MSTSANARRVLLKEVARKSKASAQQQKNAARTEATILKKAEELFAVFGYDAVSTKQLAASANVTIGALYHYFPSKEALYEKVTLTIFDRKSLMPENFADEGDGVRSKMKKLIATFIGNILSDRHYGLLLQRELLNPDTKAAEKLINRHFKPAYDLFRQLLAELLPDANQDMAFASLLSLCIGFTNLRGIQAFAPDIQSRLDAPEELAGYIIDMIMHGLDPR